MLTTRSRYGFGIYCLGALATFGLALGCDSSSKSTSADAGGTGGSTATTGALYQRLGAEPGIRAVITDFVGRVVADPKINGFFLNSSVDGGRLTNCLVLQVGALTGGPQTYPSMGCRDMKTTHAGLKISMNDFNDLAGHLVAALTAAGVAQADVNTIVAAVTPAAPDIVEDPTNNGTVYQRVGRKPAIATVVNNFVARVAANASINGFFSATNISRLTTCLVRQVCSIDGPCKYGQEVDGAEPGVSAATPCRSMMTTHLNLTSAPAGGAGARPITKADFDALVGDLVTELDAAGVTASDKMAVLGALGPACPQIVAGGTGCQ